MGREKSGIRVETSNGLTMECLEELVKLQARRDYLASLPVDPSFDTRMRWYITFCVVFQTPELSTEHLTVTMKFLPVHLFDDTRAYNFMLGAESVLMNFHAQSAILNSLLDKLSMIPTFPALMERCEMRPKAFRYIEIAGLAMKFRPKMASDLVEQEFLAGLPQSRQLYINYISRIYAGDETSQEVKEELPSHRPLISLFREDSGDNSDFCSTLPDLPMHDLIDNTSYTFARSLAYDVWYSSPQPPRRYHSLAQPFLSQYTSTAIIVYQLCDQRDIPVDLMYIVMMFLEGPPWDRKAGEGESQHSLLCAAIQNSITEAFRIRDV